MNATAFIVGPEGLGKELDEAVRQLGLAAVLPFAGMEVAERRTRETPICFFLFAAVPDMSSLRPTADAIRFAASRRLRFSPMIYFANTAPAETIMNAINMGFDDIIIRPFQRKAIGERFERQIGNVLTYYETSTYFGPDRRERMPGQRRSGDNRVGAQFRRLEIVRNLISGINVLRDELFQP